MDAATIDPKKGCEKGVRVFCVSCGKAYEASHAFCNHCGHALPSIEGQATGQAMPDEPISNTSAPPSLNAETQTYHLRDEPATLAPDWLALPKTPPYANFVLLFLGSSLCISGVIFNITDEFSRKRWEATTSTVVLTLVAALFARIALGQWRRVVALEPENDPTFRHCHRRLIRNISVIIFFIFATGAIIGIAIGRNRADAAQLATDLGRMSSVGARISKARNNVEPTIAAFIQMYKTIEPDVHELEAIFQRLKTELALYDGKFPDQHAQTLTSIGTMETGLRRMVLLKQQIEIAKRIETLDSEQQFAAWKTQMMPIIANEDALAKPK